MQKETKAINIQTERSQFREHSSPLYLTSSFCFENAQMGKELFNKELEGNIYSRFSNPTVQEFIDKVCMFEDAETGVATATGMGAIFATLAGHLQSGDHIVSSRALFGSAHQIISQILPKWGVSYTYIDAAEPQEVWEAAIKPNTKLLYVETPSNPGLELVDLEMIGQLAKNHGIISCVDNCFASPICQNPATFGIDLIIHSATKFMDGQGRVLGGVVVGSEEHIEPIRFFNRQTGSALSPFNAWVLSKSLETLSLRMEKHCSNALSFAKALEGICKVKYPFLESHPQYNLATKQMSAGGALVTIELDGGFERINRFTKLLKIPSLTSNLGDSRTTITNPFTTTHNSVENELKKQLGISEGLMRVSIGLENCNDLITDFKQAIEKS